MNVLEWDQILVGTSAKPTSINITKEMIINYKKSCIGVRHCGEHVLGIEIESEIKVNSMRNAMCTQSGFKVKAM